MIETKKKTIDKLKISVTQWPARKAFKHKRKLGYIFGPALGEIASGLENAKSGDSDSLLDGDYDLSKLGVAFEKLFDRLTDEEIDSIFEWMFSGVRIDEKELTEDSIDVIFAGKMVTVYKVMGFVLEVNFGSFLGQSGIGKLLKKSQTA